MLLQPWESYDALSLQTQVYQNKSWSFKLTKTYIKFYSFFRKVFKKLKFQAADLKMRNTFILTIDSAPGIFLGISERFQASSV